MSYTRFVNWSVSCLVVGVACLVWAPEAAAQRGILGWLDRLSGPGPFTLIGAEVEVACYGVKRPPGSAHGNDVAGGEASAVPAASSLWALDPGCFWADRRRPRLNLVVQAAWLFDGENPLQYGGTSGQGRGGGFLFMPAIDLSLNRYVDVGVGLGLVRVTGDDFDAFTRGAVQPFRVTLRPLAGIGDDGGKPGHEWLQVRAAGLLLGPFDAEDFGADPGTYLESGELQWQVLLLIDLGTLAWDR